MGILLKNRKRLNHLLLALLLPLPLVEQLTLESKHSTKKDTSLHLVRNWSLSCLSVVTVDSNGNMTLICLMMSFLLTHVMSLSARLMVLVLLVEDISRLLPEMNQVVECFTLVFSRYNQTI